MYSNGSSRADSHDGSGLLRPQSSHFFEHGLHGNLEKQAPKSEPFKNGFYLGWSLAQAMPSAMILSRSLPESPDACTSFFASPVSEDRM